MAFVVVPYPLLRPRDSCAASSFFRAPAPSCAGRVRFDPCRVLMAPEDAAARDGKRRRCHELGLPVSLPAKHRRVRDDGRDDAPRAGKKQAGGRAASPVAHLSCARIRPVVRAPRPKEDTAKVSARAVRDDAHGVIKQKAGESISCIKIKPAVQESRSKAETHVSAREVRHDAHSLTKKKQEASELVQATTTTSSPQPAQPAPATKPDPYAAHDARRAALAVFRQALDRRQNIYRRRREQARRELDKVVQTVEFNDHYIAPEDVHKPLIISS